MIYKKLSLVNLWGIFFYLIFIFQASIIFLIDANQIGNVYKWRFVSPSFISLTYLILSISGFYIAYFIYSYIFLQRAPIRLNVKFKYKYLPSISSKIFLLFVVMTYSILSIFVFTENYRLSGNAISMLVMGPLNTLLWSMTLVFIMSTNLTKKRNFILIFIGLTGLILNMSGIGAFIIILALIFLYFLVNTNLSLKYLLLVFFLGALLTFITLIFVLIFKYGFELNDIKKDNLLYLIGWIIQRLLTVPGSSIYLIENYYSSSPDFGIFEAFNIFLNNFYKIIGANGIEPAYASLGQFNLSIFYSGNSRLPAGASPGLLGGAIYFLPWYAAALLSGVILFLLLLIISIFWGIYFVKQNWFCNLIFFYFFIYYLLLNPYAWFSIIDPGLIKFSVFITRAVITN